MPRRLSPLSTALIVTLSLSVGSVAICAAAGLLSFEDDGLVFGTSLTLGPMLLPVLFSHTPSDGMPGVFIVAMLIEIALILGITALVLRRWSVFVCLCVIVPVWAGFGWLNFQATFMGG